MRCAGLLTPKPSAGWIRVSSFGPQYSLPLSLTCLTLPRILNGGKRNDQLGKDPLDGVLLKEFLLQGECREITHCTGIENFLR